MIEGVHGLEGRRVLIVEDECIIAMELECTLTECGAEVVGSCTTVQGALEKIDQSCELDAAVLDIELGGQYVGPVAEKLIRIGIPFVIASAHEAKRYALKFKGVPWLEKPVNPTAIAAAISSLQRQRSLF
jgi:two-component SAPR family response regulator